MIKQVITTMAVCFCFCAGQSAWAQPEGMAPHDTLQGERPRFAEVPNPEKQAKRQTDRLKEALQLTDKQYKKVYKLLLKEQKELLQAVTNAGGGNGRPMGGPGGGGQPPMGGGGQPPMGGGGQPPMGGGGQPPMGGGGQPPMGGGNGSTAEELKEKAEKRAKAKEKKMKKILTGEQYAKWQEMTPERPEPRQPGQPGQPGQEGERPEHPMPAQEG